MVTGGDQENEEEKKENKKKEKEDGRSRLQTRRTRPCAIIIKPTEGKSHADIINEVKKEPTLQEVGLAVARVRKTLAGDVLLILDKDNQDKIATFSEKIRVVLGGDVTINARVQLITLEITRLDGTATKEEAHNAVTKAFGEGPNVHLDVVYVRKTYGGMKKAILRLPIQAARKLLEKPTIRVNWSNCQIREIIKPTKCFKCWQYSHHTKNSNAEVDRSNCCIKCGEEDHKAESCIGQPCCVLCKTHVGNKTNHVPGRECPVQEKAYQAYLQK